MSFKDAEQKTLSALRDEMKKLIEGQDENIPGDMWEQIENGEDDPDTYSKYMRRPTWKTIEGILAAQLDNES